MTDTAGNFAKDLVDFPGGGGGGALPKGGGGVEGDTVLVVDIGADGGKGGYRFDEPPLVEGGSGTAGNLPGGAGGGGAAGAPGDASVVIGVGTDGGRRGYCFDRPAFPEGGGGSPAEDLLGVGGTALVVPTGSGGGGKGLTGVYNAYSFSTYLEIFQGRPK